MKCGNCQTDDMEAKHRRCPNCGAVNSAFEAENKTELETLRSDKTRLEAENEELKKRVPKDPGTI